MVRHSWVQPPFDLIATGHHTTAQGNALGNITQKIPSPERAEHPPHRINQAPFFLLLPVGEGWDEGLMPLDGELFEMVFGDHKKV
jgi:hypothetical protein